MIKEIIDGFTELTKTQKEVYYQLTKGKSVDEIGETLHISPKTVKNHFTEIYSRLEIKSQRQALALIINKLVSKVNV